MAAVIAVLVILMVAGIGLTNGTGPQSRKTGTDMLTGMIEQARTAAITSHCHVVLAVAEPGDLPSVDTRCRIGLFKVESWPDTGTTETITGVLMNRWQTLETGIALTGGEVDGMENPLDTKELTITYGAEKSLNVTVHAIAFNPHGGLQYPAGSNPIAMRVAEGSYRNGKASPNRHGSSGTITENLLKIGRVTARPYRIDG
jgi:hypothetical protein